MLDYSLNELIEKLMKFANEINSHRLETIEKKRKYTLLEAEKKIKFAYLFLEKSLIPKAKEREMLVYTSDEWRKYNDELTNAEVEYDIAKSKLDNAIVNWETCRSFFSVKKQELNTLGGI